MVATLYADLSDIPKSHWKTERAPDGRMYYSIETVICISMQSSLEFYITIDGKKCGSVKAKYE